MTRPSHIARAERDIALGKLSARGQAVAASPSPPYCLHCERSDREAPLTQEGGAFTCAICKRAWTVEVGSESGIAGRVPAEGSEG